VTAGRLRVATWNVRNGFGVDGWRSWPFRRGDATETVRALDADVIGLQEVHGWQLPTLRRAVPRHVAVGDGRGRRGRGERCALLVGPALRIVRHRTLWFSDTPTVPGTTLPGATHPRVVTLAELEELATGARLGVAVAHLDQRLEDNRATSASMLLGWMDAALPWVVLGDLNAGPDSPTLRRLEAGGFRSALPPEAGGTAHQLTGTLDGPRIDHVLVRGAWQVDDARILHVRPGGRLPSDHWPVVADLRRT
jgi:endonuclease/exonuclease/phosphatase family metal-dependent hydrolase